MEELIIIINAKLFRDPQEQVVRNNARAKGIEKHITQILMLSKPWASPCLVNNARILGPT